MRYFNTHLEDHLDALESVAGLYETTDALVPLSLETDLLREGVFHFPLQDTHDGE